MFHHDGMTPPDAINEAIEEVNLPILPPANPPQSGVTSLLQNILATSLGMTKTIVPENFSTMLTVAPEPAMRMIDKGKRLSECHLWKMQNDYYSNLGISAWENSVPFLITNSTYIGETYADMIISFIRDYRDKLDTSEPLYIVEISAGTGRFSFHLMKELARKFSLIQSCHSLNVKYVMTDITEFNINFWSQHEKLQPFIEAGVLDFAIYRPEESDEIHLINAGMVLSKNNTKNPMVFIANYMFDTISHDSFKVENGKLYERLINLSVPEEIADVKPLIDIGAVRLEFDTRKLRNSNYYPEPSFNALLEEYRTMLDDESFIFPVGALRCIENMRSMSNDNFVLISSDKGYTDISHNGYYHSHGYSVHGSFSFLVNYDIISRSFAHRGKKGYTTPGLSLTLETVCYINTPEETASMSFENLSMFYAEKMSRVEPITSLVELTKILHGYTPAEADVNTIVAVLSVLKISYKEPQIFCQVAPFILSSIHCAQKTQIDDLVRIMEETWLNYYFFKGECQLAFWLSQVYEAIGRLPESVYFLQQAIQYYGAHESLHYLTGDCLQRLEQLDDAKLHYEAALLLKPDFQEAQDRLLELAS